MKPSAYFINVARGRSVVTAALVDALNNKKIAGAGLDVTDPEPLPADHPLWGAPGLLLTPHVGGSVPGGMRRAFAVVADQLSAFARGEQPPNLVEGSY
jgi:phosphoglycerate dehydrogenase-like enzyme